MNDFTARKLGEVLAFGQIGEETYARGKDALAQAMPPETAWQFMDDNKKLVEAVIGFAAREKATEAVMKKADATGQKLKSMRDLYLKEDDWNDPAEMCEWLGFFEGAAVVHWSVIQGAAETLNSDELRSLAQSGADLHHKFLHEIVQGINKIARQKSAQ